LTTPRTSLVKNCHWFWFCNYYLVVALPEPGIFVLSLVLSDIYLIFILVVQVVLGFAK
jgi:hypothetical protein